MAIDPSGPKRIRVYREPNGSFATDHTGTLGDFADLPVVDGSVNLTLNKPMESPRHMQQDLDSQSAKVHLPKSATLSFQCNLETFTTKSGDGVTAVENAVGTLFRSGLGHVNLGVGDTISDVSPSASSFDVATIARWGVGYGIGVVDSGSFYVSEIKSISSSTITLSPTLPVTPSNGATLYNPATYYLGNDIGSDTDSVQMILEGSKTTDKFLLLGGQWSGPPTFDLQNGQIPKVTFNYTFADWLYQSETTGLSATALASATYTAIRQVVVNDSYLFTGISPGTTHASQIGFTLGTQYARVTSPGNAAAVNNTLQWIRTRGQGPVVSGSFVTEWNSQDFFAQRDAVGDQTDIVLFQMGSVSGANGGGVALSAPSVQYTDVQLQDVDGIRSLNVKWEGTTDQNSSKSTPVADLESAAFKVHMF